MTDTTLHTKYRPTTIDDLIGHEHAVTQLKGMLKGEQFPGAILITGPSSVGKTTLARAIAASINGKSIKDQGGEYKEMNGADSKTIDDMRDLIRISKFKPSNKKRIVVIDEAQQVLSNPHAASVLLKPIEDAGSTDTIWILCSMDPAKFNAGNGKAIANRCVQFVLEPHSNGDMLKQAIRIVKGEKMSYLQDKEVLKKVVLSANSEMRTLANLLQGIRDYAEGLEKLPKMLDAEAVSKVLKSAESNDDAVVVAVIVGVLSGKYAQVHRALLDVTEPYQFVNKLGYAAHFLLSNAALDGAKHPKVWWSATNRELVTKLKDVKPTLGAYAALNECVVNLKIQASSFTVGEVELISSRFYRLIKDIFSKE